MPPSVTAKFSSIAPQQHDFTASSFSLDQSRGGGGGGTAADGSFNLADQSTLNVSSAAPAITVAVAATGARPFPKGRVGPRSVPLASLATPSAVLATTPAAASGSASLQIPAPAPAPSPPFGTVMPASFLLESSSPPPFSSGVTPGARMMLLHHYGEESLMSSPRDIATGRSQGGGGGGVTGQSQAAGGASSRVLESMESDEFEELFATVDDFGMDSAPSGFTTGRNTARTARGGGGGGVALSASPPALPPQPNPVTPRHTGDTVSVVTSPPHSRDVPLHSHAHTSTSQQQQQQQAGAAAAVTGGHRGSVINSYGEEGDDSNEDGDLENFAVTEGGIYDLKSP